MTTQLSNQLVTILLTSLLPISVSHVIIIAYFTYKTYTVNKCKQTVDTQHSVIVSM